MHQNKDTFNFTYSAAHREEVEHIRSKYMKSQECDLDGCWQEQRRGVGEERVRSMGSLQRSTVSSHFRKGWSPSCCCCCC